MKKLFGIAAVGFLLALPAHAQQRMMSGGTGPTSNGGGGVGGGGAMGGGGGSFRTLPTVPRAQFQAIDVSGSAIDFTPSSWTQYKDGLARGEAELAAQKKTLAEVAAENRHSDKPKARLIITQDAIGDAIIQRQ